MSSATRKFQKVLTNKIYKTAISIWWGMLGDYTMWAKSDEHNRNEDAEMDTRKNKRKYHVRNVNIREKAHTEPINAFLMKKRLSWFGHVQRRDDGSVANSMLNTQIDGSSPQEKTQAEVDGPVKRWSKIRYAQSARQTERAGSIWSKTSTLPRKRRKYEKVIQ